MQPLKLSKEKMQFTKLFKVIFTLGLVKGVRLAPAKLNPLFSLRIVNYMCLTHATGPPPSSSPQPTIKATRRKRLARTQEKQLKKLITSNNYLPTMYKALF